MFALSLSLVCRFELNSFKEKDEGVSVSKNDVSENKYFVGKNQTMCQLFF